MGKTFGLDELRKKISRFGPLTNNELKGLEGERDVLIKLEKYLNDDSVIISDPYLQGHRADILIIDNDLGFIFVEVKNWSRKSLEEVDSNGLFTMKWGQERPLRQTEQYQNQLKQIILSKYTNKDIHRFIS